MYFLGASNQLSQLYLLWEFIRIANISPDYIVFDKTSWARKVQNEWHSLFNYVIDDLIWCELVIFHVWM